MKSSKLSSIFPSIYFVLIAILLTVIYLTVDGYINLQYFSCSDDKTINLQEEMNYGEAGTIVWDYEVKGWITSSPAVANGRVYIGTTDDGLLCLNSRSGELEWSFPIEGDKNQDQWIVSSPAVVNNRVYFGANNQTFYCLEAFTGEEIWSFLSANTIQSSALYIHDKIYFSDMNVRRGRGSVRCLDAIEGKTIWVQYTSPIYSSPCYFQNNIYLGSQDGNVFCVEANTGDLIWEFPTEGEITSSPLAAAGRIIIGSWDKNVYCLDAFKGEILWKYSTDGDIGSSADMEGNKIVIGSMDFNLYCIDFLSGDLIWKFNTDNTITGSPLIIDQRVYCGSNDGNVYCLNAENAKLIWKVSTSDLLVSSPAIYKGKLYIAAKGGTIFCIETGTQSTKGNSLSPQSNL